MLIYFNPRTPCGVRRGGTLAVIGGLVISIHAPLAGCDTCRRGPARRPRNFNPRTPCGVRRVDGVALTAAYAISIHAPLAGCDVSVLFLSTAHDRFQSTHPLRGATIQRAGLAAFLARFQSTHPLRGATLRSHRQRRQGRFQSTHPLRGATPNCRPSRKTQRDFNPRTPCGVRPISNCPP